MILFRILLPLLILLPAITQGAEPSPAIDHYDIQVDFHPAKDTLGIKATLQLRHFTHQPIELILNKSAVLSAVTIDGRSADYQFDSTGPSPNFYIDDGRRLTITPAGGQQNGDQLVINYQVDTKAINYLKNNEGLETGLYTAWFPLSFDYGKFSYRLSLTLPTDQQLTGNGTVSRQGNHWQLHNGQPGMDIVLVSSEKLNIHTLDLGNARLELADMGNDPEQIRRLLSDLNTLMPALQARLGKPDGGGAQYRFVLVPRSSGPSYSRDGFAVVTRFEPTAYRRLIRTIAHEVGHFWWNHAPTDSWQDWLNESFAEYASVMAIERLYGSGEKVALLTRYRQQSAKVAAIAGLPRTDDQAHTALYSKGPLIIDELRQRLGDEAFFTLLRQINRERVSSTGQLLELLSRRHNSQLARWLDARLHL